MSLRFTVLGNAIGQGNKTAGVNPRTGKVFMREGRTGEAAQRFKSWREAVRAEAQRAVEGSPGYPLSGPLCVRISFGLAKPASAPKRTRTWPIKVRSGDLDKMQRACFDSMSGVIYRDDAQVVEVHARKDWATQPGATIDIEQITDD